MQRQVPMRAKSEQDLPNLLLLGLLKKGSSGHALMYMFWCYSYSDETGNIPEAVQRSDPNHRSGKNR